MSDFRFPTENVVPVPERHLFAGHSARHFLLCLGCGSENRPGLRVRPRKNDVVAEFEFAPRFRGGPWVVHGGAPAAFFDGLMVFVMAAHAVTARPATNYLRPIPPGLILRAGAYPSGCRERQADAVDRDEGGRLCLEARALFLGVAVDYFADTIPHMDPAQISRVSRCDSGDYHP